MKPNLKITWSLFVLSFLVFSFTPKTSTDIVGIFGDDLMQLVLNEDNTFSYANTFTLKEKKITGTWEIQKGKIRLTSLEKTSQLPKKWVLKNGGKTVKTRKGMAFYTLQKNCD